MSTQPEASSWETVVQPMIGRFRSPLSADEWTEFVLWWEDYADKILGAVPAHLETWFAVALILETWHRRTAWSVDDTYLPGNWGSIDSAPSLDSAPLLVITPQFTTATGNRRDFALDLWNGTWRRGLLVECDSKEWHEDWEQSCDDRRRDRIDLAAGEPPVVRFDGPAVFRHPERAAIEALAVLAALTEGVTHRPGASLDDLASWAKVEDGRLWDLLSDGVGLRRSELALAMGMDRREVSAVIDRLKHAGRVWYDKHSQKWYAVGDDQEEGTYESGC